MVTLPPHISRSKKGGFVWLSDLLKAWSSFLTNQGVECINCGNSEGQRFDEISVSLVKESSTRSREKHIAKREVRESSE